MKNTLCFLALLLFVVTAHAQADSGVIRGFATDQYVIDLQKGANTAHTTPEDEVFTIEMDVENDTTFILTSAMVKTRRGEIVLNPVSETRLSVDCPRGSEAVFFADETQKYQMGICASDEQHTRALVHVNGSVGRVSTGVDLNKE